MTAREFPCPRCGSRLTIPQPMISSNFEGCLFDKVTIQFVCTACTAILTWDTEAPAYTAR